jgi:hypothetical protein
MTTMTSPACSDGVFLREKHMDIAAFIISLSALGFTISSFWWMNWRRGDVLVGDPRTYAASNTDASLMIEFPLVLYNTGPRPILIENLRLILLDEGVGAKPLFFNAVVDKLATDEGREYATQFPLQGNTTIRKICEFHRKPANFTFKAKKYRIELQASLNDRKEWVTLKTFDLNVLPEFVAMLNSNTLMARDNWID